MIFERGQNIEQTVHSSPCIVIAHIVYPLTLLLLFSFGII